MSFQLIIKGLFATVFTALLPALGNISMFRTPQIWVLFGLGMLVMVFQPEFKAEHFKTMALDRGTQLQIFISIIVTQFLAVAEASYLRYPSSVRWDWVTTAALCVTVAGLLLRTWAVAELGRHFTLHLTRPEQAAVVRSGPYRYMRHPGYTGAFLIFISGPVFLHSWYSLILAAILLPLAYARRIYHEENMLEQEFGEDYAKYKKEVKCVVPYLL